MSELDYMLKSAFKDISDEFLMLNKKLATQKLMLYFKNKLKREITEYELEREYTYALFLLISNELKFEDLKGIKSIEQGNKKTVFVEKITSSTGFKITDDIKALLPPPLVRFKG